MGRHDGCHKVTCIRWKHGGRALCEAIPANLGSALVYTIAGRLDVVLLQGLSIDRGPPLKATMLHYGLLNQRINTTLTMSMSLNNFNLTLAARRCASDGSRAVMTRKRSHGPARPPGSQIWSQLPVQQPLVSSYSCSAPFTMAPISRLRFLGITFNYAIYSSPKLLPCFNPKG